MIKKVFLFCLCLFVLPVMAQNLDDFHINENPTDCASQIFSNALIEHANEIDESEPEFKVRAWAKETMTGNADVLKAVLDCPEVKNTADETTVIFPPIEFKFSGGRTLTINYSTQPKVLKQKLLLSQKHSLPNGNMSPDLMDIMDGSKYLNTEPAWYAIMVVQHDSLKDFVGAGKNNTLSVKYINDHIDDIYPQGYFCTSKSVLANDDDTINQVVHQVVNIEDDSNDYYVAGDVNLEWIMYAEIAADVILTVATMGAMAQLKTVRAFKNAKSLLKSINQLKKIDKVQNYADKIKQISKYTADIEKLEKERKSIKDAKEIATKRDEIKKLQESIKTLGKETDELVKTSKDVKQYKEQAETYKDLHKYFTKITAFKRPQTGNIITRNLKKIGTYAKTIKASQTGAKTMTRAGKMARAGMSTRSAKMKSWLFDSTFKHGARLARFERDAGMLYGFLAFMGDMYDKTSNTSKEFSNGIEFKPLCLLSADDLNGQENVVNYGMWLMWVGNSIDQNDDDAAYLQAMDFASKFYYQLDEFQDENGANCNVDIYVVRPIIRLDETNVDEPRGEMFYLFMNEIPWSTSEQFNAKIGNIEDWEKVQSELDKTDPQNKYKHQNNNDSENLQEQVAAQETQEQTGEPVAE